MPKNVHFSVPRRQLKADIVSPTADALAAQYDLGTQLDLPLLSDPRYFIADIDAETLSVMEEEPGSRQRVLKKYLDAQYGGLLGGTVVGNARDLLFDSRSRSSSNQAGTFRIDGFFKRGQACKLVHACSRADATAPRLEP